MKKICAMLCCVLLLQMLCACGEKKAEYQKPVAFYYCAKEISYNTVSGVLQAETREGVGFHGNLDAFLKSYLSGPESSQLQSLIPADARLVSCDMDGDVVSIEFSEQFAKLTGIKLTTACSAILMSVHEFNDAQALRIRVKGAKLDDKDEFVLTMDDIVLMDTVTVNE